MIPACWPRHPHLVHEIAVLADLRRRAGHALTGDAMEEWHRYALPAFTERMRQRMKGHCEDKDHQPWPAQGRHTRHLTTELGSSPRPGIPSRRRHPHQDPPAARRCRARSCTWSTESGSTRTPAKCSTEHGCDSRAACSRSVPPRSAVTRQVQHPGAADRAGRQMFLGPRGHCRSIPPRRNRLRARRREVHPGLPPAHRRFRDPEPARDPIRAQLRRSATRVRERAMPGGHPRHPIDRNPVLVGDVSQPLPSAAGRHPLDDRALR